MPRDSDFDRPVRQRDSVQYQSPGRNYFNLVNKDWVSNAKGEIIKKGKNSLEVAGTRLGTQESAQVKIPLQYEAYEGIS